LKNALLAAAAALISLCGAASLAQTPAPVAAFEGPITGPGPVFPGLRPLDPGTDPKDYGYLTEEYFVSGTANGLPYTTRILVRRPKQANRFSGIVVTESMHSNGFAVTFEPSRHSILLRGHVHVEIAAQQGNVNGTLKGFNAERYARLSIASGQQTSQIIAQVGALLRANLRDGPLHSLRARHLIMMGTSQSSGVLRTYQTQQHFQARLASGGPIMEGYLAVSTLGNAPMMVVDVPTIQMPTMTEVNTASGAAAGVQYRRPDSDEPGNRFRIYENAGMPHANARDSIAYEPNFCALPVSDFPWGPSVAMGLAHLVAWVDHGRTPPHAPYIEVDGNTANDGSRLALDEHGNAKGGVRNTYVDVPVATYGVPNTALEPSGAFLCSIAGWRVPFADETLNTLYKNKGDYLSDVVRRLVDLVVEGWVLPESAPDVLIDALRTDIPNRPRPPRH
jgi:hypothetical protein